MEVVNLLFFEKVCSRSGKSSLSQFDVSITCSHKTVSDHDKSCYLHIFFNCRRLWNSHLKDVLPTSLHALAQPDPIFNPINDPWLNYDRFLYTFFLSEHDCREFQSVFCCMSIRLHRCCTCQYYLAGLSNPLQTLISWFFWAFNKQTTSSYWNDFGYTNVGKYSVVICEHVPSTYVWQQWTLFVDKH